MSRMFEFQQDDKIRINYERVGLKFNPFPLGGEPSKDYPYIEISKKVTEEITEFVNTVTATKRWQGLSVYGDNGTGKTRLLFMMESEINSQLKYANAIYVNEPPADSIKLFQKIIESCDLDKLTQIIANNPNDQGKLIKIIENNMVRKPTLSEEKVASVSDEKNLVQEVGKYLKDKLPLDENIRKGYSALIIYHIISNKLRDLEVLSLQDTAISEITEIKRFLAGENVSSSLLNRLGIKPIKVDNNVMEKIIFPSFLNYNQMAEKNVVYALIDEFQSVIENVSKPKIVSILNMIIALAQTNTTGFCMVLSCLPDSWNYAIRISNSFSERFNKQISMPPLSKEVAIEMVKKYLNSGRIVPSENLNPFTEEAIRKILEMNKYNVRNFLKTMGLLLNIFVQNKKAELIDIGFVKDTIKDNQPQASLELWF
jgi:Cdc6-like AAA superfamily ATPase